MPPLTHCSLQAANALSPLQRQWPGEAFCVCQKQELLSHAPHHGSPQFSIANLDLIPCRGFGTGSQDQAAKVHALYAPVEATGRASDAARGPSRRLASSPMIRQPNLHVRASSVSHEERGRESGHAADSRTGRLPAQPRESHEPPVWWMIRGEADEETQSRCSRDAGEEVPGKDSTVCSCIRYSLPPECLAAYAR